MRITLFISALSGGGAERVTCNLANHLAGFGHDVEILTMSETDAAEPLHRGVKHVPVLKNCERGNKLIGNAKRIFRLCKYMKTQRVDAYVVMLPVTTQLMLRLSKLTKAPIVVSERADPKEYSPKTQKALQSLACRASGYVFQTDEAADWYAPYLKGVAYEVIPNAINPAFIRPAYAGERDKTVVGVGRFSQQKNFALLIKAFAKVADKFPEHRLVIYGQGNLLESYQSLAAELGVGDRVEFPGFVPDMPQRLEKAGMFVLSSDYEGMPNALMEAMALGLPCVSTDCGGGGARFLIKDGENGLLVPQKDVDAMAQAMDKILSDEEFAQKLGGNARALQNTLAPEKIYGRWEQFIYQVVKRSSKR